MELKKEMCDETRDQSPFKLQRPRVLRVSRSPSPCRVRTPSAGVPSFAVAPEPTVHTMSKEKPALADTRRENFSKENSVSGTYMLRTSKVCRLSLVPSPPVPFLAGTRRDATLNCLTQNTHIQTRAHKHRPQIQVGVHDTKGIAKSRTR